MSIIETRNDLIVKEIEKWKEVSTRIEIFKTAEEIKLFVDCMIAGLSKHLEKGIVLEALQEDEEVIAGMDDPNDLPEMVESVTLGEE